MGKYASHVIVVALLLIAGCHCRPQGYSYSSPSPGLRPNRPFQTQGPGPAQNTYRPSGSFSDDYSEPANYQFQYDVTAPEYGTFFGHQESRMGESTRGRYHVTLPDGRTQVVEYTADETGYHPRISYS